MFDRKWRVPFFAFAFVLATTMTVWCQKVPDAPVPAPVLLSHTEAPAEFRITDAPPSQRIADKKFAAVSVLVMGLTISDLEKTQHCLAHGTCVEMNPMLPTSRAGMYAVNVPMNAATMYLAYRLKASGHKTWWIAPAIVTAGHLLGTAYRF